MPVSTPHTDTGATLRALVTNLGGVTAAAHRAGVSVSTLHDWLRRGGVPSAAAAVALLEAAGRSTGLVGTIAAPRVERPDVAARNARRVDEWTPEED